MSEYNIPVLVKGDLPHRLDWNDNALTAIGCVLKMRDLGDGFFGDVHGIWWDPREVIPNPTPSQIEEEARKAGKAPVTTKPLVDPMTVNWPISDFAVGMEVVKKPGHEDYWREYGLLDKKILTIIKKDGSSLCPFWVESPVYKLGACINEDLVVPLSKIREYEAAQSAQKGPMEPKQAKPPKPTIVEEALRKAREKVKAIEGIEALDREIAELRFRQSVNADRLAELESKRISEASKWLPKVKPSKVSKKRGAK